MVYHPLNTFSKYSFIHDIMLNFFSFETNSRHFFEKFKIYIKEYVKKLYKINVDLKLMSTWKNNIDFKETLKVWKTSTLLIFPTIGLYYCFIIK